MYNNTVRLTEILDNLNITFGFNLYFENTCEILENQIYKTEDLVKKLFILENSDPTHEISLFRQIRNFLIHKFGNEIELIKS